MKRIILLLVIFILVIGSFLLLMILRLNFQTARDQSAIAAQMAQMIYLQKKDNGTDFSSSPCLSNNLMPDWVADIAHNPRQPVDDQPENQCPAFLDGSAHHFVELDPQGNLIRAI